MFQEKKVQCKDKEFYCARRESDNAAEISLNIFLLKVDVEENIQERSSVDAPWNERTFQG